MILVDTSVWIEFFKANPDYFSSMESLLENRNIVTIEPIFAELIYGSRNEKERNLIISYWKILPRIKFAEGSFLESADYANLNSFHNKGVGLIDSILIRAVVDNEFHIWTVDKKIINNMDAKYLYSF